MLELSGLPTTPGTIVDDKFRVETVIGEGSMGVVVRALHLGLGTHVALKFLLPEMLDEDVIVERFAREARVAARLTSDHVARVLDTGTLKTGMPYIVMEYLAGDTLQKVMKKRQRLPVEEACAYMIQICDALIEAHGLGIAHRDLKPANLMLATRPNGTKVIKVLDFGISKVMSSSTALTNPVAVLGTPMYMAPEQLTSPNTVDTRADIWSCGVCLYWMLTGVPPFDGKNLIELKMKMMRGSPPDPLALRPELPRDLGRIVRGCLQVDVDARVQSAQELSDALGRFARFDEPSDDDASSETTVLAAGSVDPETMKRPARDEPLLGSESALTVATSMPSVDRDAPTIARPLDELLGRRGGRPDQGRAPSDPPHIGHMLIEPDPATQLLVSPGVNDGRGGRQINSPLGAARRRRPSLPSPRPSSNPPQVAGSPTPQAPPMRAGHRPAPGYEMRNARLAPTVQVTRRPGMLQEHAGVGIFVVIAALLSAALVLAKLGGCFAPRRASAPTSVQAPAR